MTNILENLKKEKEKEKEGRKVIVGNKTTFKLPIKSGILSHPLNYIHYTNVSLSLSLYICI